MWRLNCETIEKAHFYRFLALTIRLLEKKLLFAVEYMQYLSIVDEIFIPTDCLINALIKVIVLVFGCNKNIKAFDS